MTRASAFAAIDPVDRSKLERVSSSVASKDLRRWIVASDPHGNEREPERALVALAPVSGRPKLAAALSVAAVVVIVVGVLVLGGGGSGPTRSRTAAVKTGTWKLADDVLSGTWQQSTTGPPPGVLTCPIVSTCYTMSGKYASPGAGSRLLSESVYVSTDAGATWTGFLMPQGFDPTSPIACGGPTECAAGGTARGQPVLAATSDGGHTWQLAPLPQGVGNLETLSCPSPGVCAGLAAHSDLQLGATNATFLFTRDRGEDFTDEPIIAGDSMQSLSCSSSLVCTSVGWSNTRGPNDWTSGVAAKTTDGGQTWTPGALPAGLGVSYLSQLSCGDALHCTMTGTIAITVNNPTKCSTQVGPGQGTTSQSIPTSVQSPAVQAIAQAAGQAATEQEQKDAESGAEIYSCGGPTTKTVLIGALASSVDGGASWTPDPLPTGLPKPTFFGLSCPSDNECWATGSDAMPTQVGAVASSNQPLLLGTTNGGSSWSNVTFSAPQGVPNDLAQSYFATGSISCPSAGNCVALGIGDAGTSSVPAYSLQTAGQSG